MDEFGYVNELSLTEKILFLRLIIKLVGADGKVDEQERTFVRELMQQYQIPKEYSAQVSQQVTKEQLLTEAKNLLNRKKSLYLIKELLAVANTDEDLEDHEIDFVIDVSSALQIEDAKVAEINQLVLDQLSVFDRYHRVLEEE